MHNQPAFILSCAFGAVGVVLILVGALIDNNPVLYVGVFAGFLSLVSALAWRAELVSSWARRKGARRPRRY